jgi:amicyanin
MKYILPVFLIATIFVVGCVQQSPSNSNNPTVPGQYNVAAENFAFNPAELRIKAGDTVVWTNKDTALHTITSDSGNEISSSSLSNGQTYSHTFATKGTYDYHCSIHTSMKAKIIVE